MIFCDARGGSRSACPTLIDIVATAILAYYVLLLIRGTRAVQIVLGLLVVLIMLAVSNLLHLLVLTTILQYVLLGTAVTLPIVFQPELRRALEQLGRGGILRRRETDSRSDQPRSDARRCWRAPPSSYRAAASAR